MTAGLARIAATGEEENDHRRSSLEGLVGYNLKRAYIALHKDFRRTLDRDDLPPRVFATLSLVAESPAITQSDVARRLGIERSGLVAIVDGLEQRGLVRRTAFPGDRRIQALHPTAAGIALHERARAAVEDHEERMLGMLSSAERRQLLTLLKKVRAGSGEA